MFTYFICLEIPQNFARNKKKCIFAKDLFLKAEFLKKIWPIDTSLHTVVVTQLARVFEVLQSLAIFTYFIYLEIPQNFARN